MSDAFDLDRFVTAQAPIYTLALAELRAGRKRSHWMWFIFPQLRALGRSATAIHYGIGTIEEARAYRAHPVLGPRLDECCAALLLHRDQSPAAIMGEIDALKLRSSMTLFERTAEPTPFAAVLDAFYDGARDPLTLELLNAPAPPPPR